MALSVQSVQCKQLTFFYLLYVSYVHVVKYMYVGTSTSTFYFLRSVMCYVRTYVDLRSQRGTNVSFISLLGTSLPLFILHFTYFKVKGNDLQMQINSDFLFLVVAAAS